MQCKVEVFGRENLPDADEKKVLYLANHASLMDIPILYGWVDWRPAFVAKRTLLWVPIVGQWLWILGCVMLSRKASKKELRKFYRIRDKLDEGLRFFLFPEGTRSRTGEVGQFRAVKKIMELDGLRVVPVHISGSYEVVRAGSFALNPGQITVYIGNSYLISKDDSVENSFTAAQALAEIEKWMIDNK